MMICTFFGNRQIYRPVEDELVKILMDLIEHKNVNLFYVGNHGQFDTLVCRMLRTICQQYPVQYFVVTAYLPTKQNEYENVSHVLYPDGLETAPPKYAIVKRNEWMINQANFVVTCIDDPFGNAAKMQEKALKKGKTIIRLGKY